MKQQLKLSLVNAKCGLIMQNSKNGESLVYTDSIECDVGEVRA